MPATIVPKGRSVSSQPGRASAPARPGTVVRISDERLARIFADPDMLEALVDPIEQLRERIASEPEPDEYEQMVTLVCIIGGAVLLLGILAFGLLG